MNNERSRSPLETTTALHANGSGSDAGTFSRNLLGDQPRMNTDVAPSRDELKKSAEEKSYTAYYKALTAVESLNLPKHESSYNKLEDEYKRIQNIDMGNPASTNLTKEHHMNSLLKRTKEEYTRLTNIPTIQDTAANENVARQRATSISAKMSASNQNAEASSSHPQEAVEETFRSLVVKSQYEVNNSKIEINDALKDLSTAKDENSIQREEGLSTIGKMKGKMKEIIPQVLMTSEKRRNMQGHLDKVTSMEKELQRFPQRFADLKVNLENLITESENNEYYRSYERRNPPPGYQAGTLENPAPSYNDARRDRLISAAPPENSSGERE